MTLQQLKYLVSIVDEGGINEAAKKCNVRQPTISAQIKKLEEELKIDLFDRENYPVSATPLGELLAAQAKIVLKEYDLMKDIIKNYKKGIVSPARQPIITTNAELKKASAKQKKHLKQAIETLKILDEELNELKKYSF